MTLWIRQAQLLLSVCQLSKTDSNRMYSYMEWPDVI